MNINKGILFILGSAFMLILLLYYCLSSSRSIYLAECASDGKSLVTASLDGKNSIVEYWDIHPNSEIVCSGVLAESRYPITVIAISENGTLVSTGDLMGRISVRACKNNKLLLQGEQEPNIIGLAFCDNSHLIALSECGIVRRWDLSKGSSKEVLETDVPRNCDSRMALSANGNLLAVSKCHNNDSSRELVTVYDLDTESKVAEFDLGYEVVWAMSIVAEEQVLLCGTIHGRLYECSWSQGTSNSAFLQEFTNAAIIDIDYLENGNFVSVVLRYFGNEDQGLVNNISFLSDKGLLDAAGYRLLPVRSVSPCELENFLVVLMKNGDVNILDTSLRNRGSINQESMPLYYFILCSFLLILSLSICIVLGYRYLHNNVTTIVTHRDLV